VIILKLALMSLQTGVDKWMTFPNMGYVIASRYNFVFSAFIIEAKYDDIPLQSKLPTDVSLH